MTIEQARNVALSYASASAAIAVDILDLNTVERSYGWVFFYDSREAIGGNDLMSLGGNGPIVVMKSGEIFTLPTYLPFEDALAAFEQRRGLVP